MFKIGKISLAEQLRFWTQFYATYMHTTEKGRQGKSGHASNGEARIISLKHAVQNIRPLVEMGIRQNPSLPFQPQLIGVVTDSLRDVSLLERPTTANIFHNQAVTETSTLSIYELA
jgi:hypothetical protein